MRRWKDLSSPFNQTRLKFESTEIDQICEDALSLENLLPSSPQAIRIDRFVEKCFRIGGVEYEDLGPDHLGYTEFTRKGEVQKIAISKYLADSSEVTASRRERSTIAHEAGHGLLHAQLFIDDDEMLLVVKQHLERERNKETPKIMCRHDDIQPAQADAKTYGGKWWEWQANRAIGGLLLPRKLVRVAVEPFLETSASSLPELKDVKRMEAVSSLAATFDVNPAVVKIRLHEMYPAKSPDSLF